MKWRSTLIAVLGVIALLALTMVLLAPNPSEGVNVAQTPLQAPAPKAPAPGAKAAHITQDGRFLAALNRDGIAPEAGYQSVVIHDAHILCESMLPTGMSHQEAASYIQANSNYNAHDARDYVERAINYYCPQFR